MTKKFVHTSKEINGAKCRNEFIIPDIFSDSPKLIGLETGLQYKAGHIVYTGVDLTVAEVLDKAEKQKKLGLLKRRKAKNTIEKYLNQIKIAKIGTAVVLSNEHELLIIENKSS